MIATRSAAGWRRGRAPLRGLAPILLAASLPAAAGERAPPSPAEYLARGDRALVRGDAHAALEPLAASAAADWPARDLAWLLLGRAQLAVGRPADALAASGRVTAAVPGSVRGADAAWLAAEASAALRRPADAAAAWRSFRERFPKDSRFRRAAVNEAAALEAAGKAREASAAWREVALEAPAEAPSDVLERFRRLARSAGAQPAELTVPEQRRRVKALAAAGLHERAVPAWRAIAEASPAEADRALLGLARSLHSLRRNDEARAACEELLERFPTSRRRAACDVVRARGAWRVDAGEALLAATRHGLEASRPGDWAHGELRYVRGGYFLEVGRWDEAVAQFERLQQEAPGSSLAAAVRWKAAWSRYLEGRLEDAARRFDGIADDSDDERAPAAALWACIARRRLGSVVGSEDLADVHRRWPFEYHGQQARELLSTELAPEALAALDAEVARRGVPFRHPGPPVLPGPGGHRYSLLRDASLHRHALDEIEALPTSSDRAFAFELAGARARGGAAAAAQRLVRKHFGRSLAHPSRDSARALWEVVYPRPWGDVVARHAAEHGVDPSLCAALIRAESWWDPEARSPVGARGLMQLMPETAARLAREAGREAFDPDQLFDPGVNVALGVRYLAELLKRFGGDEAAAVASYNAGEVKVAEWWAEFDRDGVKGRLERVERIPYRETRPYVKRVLEAAGWYRWLDAAPPPPESGS